jgi:hypothetical protein
MFEGSPDDGTQATPVSPQSEAEWQSSFQTPRSACDATAQDGKHPKASYTPKLARPQQTSLAGQSSGPSQGTVTRARQVFSAS